MLVISKRVISFIDCTAEQCRQRQASIANNGRFLILPKELITRI